MENEISLDNPYLLWLVGWWKALIADIISSREANGPLHGLGSVVTCIILQE